MNYDSIKKEIILEKELNDLDKFVIDFIEVLEKHTDYVIVSGYVSILLGRSRGSEDIDLLIPELDFQKFSRMFEDMRGNGFECANTSLIEEAFNMLEEYAIRFYKDSPVPNIEYKKISNEIHEEAFNERIKVRFSEKVLYISPLELQIAYKLSLMAKGPIEELSSDKDFEDAKHIYELFLDKLDREKLFKFVKLFNAEDKLEILQNG